MLFQAHRLSQAPWHGLSPRTDLTQNTKLKAFVSISQALSGLSLVPRETIKI